MTACAALSFPLFVKTAVQMVCMMKNNNIPMQELMKRKRRPRRSHKKDADTAQTKFQICKIPLIRSYDGKSIDAVLQKLQHGRRTWIVESVMPMVSSTLVR